MIGRSKCIGVIAGGSKGLHGEAKTQHGLRRAGAPWSGERDDSGVFDGGGDQSQATGRLFLAVFYRGNRRFRLREAIPLLPGSEI